MSPPVITSTSLTPGSARLAGPLLKRHYTIARRLQASTQHPRPYPTRAAAAAATMCVPPAAAASASASAAPAVTATNVVALDVEYAHFAAAEEDGSSEIAAPAWVALVDHNCQVLLKSYIQPQVRIANDVLAVFVVELRAVSVVTGHAWSAVPMPAGFQRCCCRVSGCMLPQACSSTTKQHCCCSQQRGIFRACQYFSIQQQSPHRPCMFSKYWSAQTSLP